MQNWSRQSSHTIKKKKKTLEVIADLMTPRRLSLKAHIQHSHHLKKTKKQNVFTMSGWFDIASQALWNKLSEEWVAVKGSLLMTNEVGESKSDCYREGKVLL